MEKKIISTVFILAIVCMGGTAGAAAVPQEFLDAASHGKLVALQTWNPSLDSDASFNCAVVQSAKEPTRSALECYQGAKRVFTFTSEQNPLAIFVMGEAGNLITLWEAGDGTYILCVFTYSDRKINKALEASSKLMPEFVYAPTPPGSLIVDATQPVTGGYWSQRIIVANMDWVHDANGGKDYLPITADIFTWDGKRYQVREQVKWAERLK